jgi:hypothetical protein
MADVILPPAAPPPPPPVPPTAGWRSSEFWLSVAAMLVGTLLDSGLIPSDSIWTKLAGVAMTILAALGYTYSRGAVKAAFHGAAKLLLLGIVISHASACGVTKDEALSKTLAGLGAARSAFTAWDAKHQDEIVGEATSLETGKAALADYRGKRKVVIEAFIAADGALAAACIAVSAGSDGWAEAFRKATDAASALLAALRTLGVVS